MSRKVEGSRREGGWVKVEKRRRKYRGRGRRNRKKKVFTLFLANVRGFVSKKTSLEKIVDNLKPTVIALNETLLYGQNKVEMKSYTSFSMNRTKTKGGGVSTSIREELRDSVVGAGESQGEDEYLITRLECYSPPLTIINCYREQEKVGEVEQEARWGRLRKELETVRARGEFCLLVGDLNKHVGCDDLGVRGNKPLVDRGGHLVRSLLATREWYLVNAMGEEVVEGGPFTRQDPATGALSCLQLFIVSKELRPYVTNDRLGQEDGGC